MVDTILTGVGVVLVIRGQKLIVLAGGGLLLEVFIFDFSELDHFGGLVRTKELDERMKSRSGW